MGLYNLLAKYDEQDKYGHIRNILEEERKEDNILNAVIDGKAKYKESVKFIEDKFTGFNKLGKNKMPLDEKFNSVVNYMGDMMDMDSYFMETGSKIDKKYWTKKTANATISTTGLIGMGIGAIFSAFLTPVGLGIGAALMLSGGGATGYSLFFNAPGRKIKKMRKQFLSEVKTRADNLDYMIYKAYKEKPVITGEDVSSVI